MQCTLSLAYSGTGSRGGKNTTFWVRSWLVEGPDCQVTPNDVRALHNQKTPARPATKDSITEKSLSCVAKVPFRPLPFSCNRKNSRKRVYIFKGSPLLSPSSFLLQSVN
jgi:hypothetical protein